MDIITSKDCGLNPNFKFGVYGNVVGDLQSKGEHKSSCPSMSQYHISLNSASTHSCLTTQPLSCNPVGKTTWS